MNAEQASKMLMWKPTRPNHGEGCHRPAMLQQQRERQGRDGSTGVLATACLHRRTDATREAPAVVACAHQPAAREEQAGPFGVSERPIVPTKRVMTVEGRGLG